MDQTTIPSGLLSHILLAQAARQKQVVAGHRGRSATKHMTRVIECLRLYSTLALLALCTGCASDASLIRSGVKPNEGEAYTTPKGGGGMRFGPEVRDPLETDPRYKDAFKQAEIKAELELKRRGIEPQLGYCHAFWHTKKRILRRDYGIDWMTPAELNPFIMYD